MIFAKLGYRLRRFLRNEHGNVLTEMALVMPVFALLGIGAFDMGRFALEFARLEQGVRAGAQTAIQNLDTVGNLSLIEAEAVEAVTIAVGADIATLTVNASTTCACGDIGGTTTPITCNSLCDDGNVALTVLTVEASHTLDPVFSIPGLIQSRLVRAEIEVLVQ